jgi:hypothetical protein
MDSGQNVKKIGMQKTWIFHQNINLLYKVSAWFSNPLLCKIGLNKLLPVVKIAFLSACICISIAQQFLTISLHFFGDLLCVNIYITLLDIF